MKRDPVVRREAPGLIEQLSEILRGREAGHEKRRRDGELHDDKRAEQAPTAAIEGCAARGGAHGAAQIRARSARRWQKTEGDANEQHHTGGEPKDRPIHPGGVIELAHCAPGDIRSFRAYGEERGSGPGGNEKTKKRAEKREEHGLDKLLPNELSPARPECGPEGKLAFPFHHPPEEQAGEIGCRNEERAQRRPHDDHNLGAQVHDKALAQRRHINVVRIGGAGLGFD